MMFSYKPYVAAGLFVGAAAGAAYVASRRVGDSVPDLVDWQRVRVMALRTGRLGAGEVPYALRQAIEGRYKDWVRQSEDLIAAYVGRDLPRQMDRVHVFDRAEWIDANIANFKLLFAPFERASAGALEQASAGGKLVGRFNQLLVSSELGFLLGYLGQRVLGQYDLAILGHEPLTAGRLYFVEPNIASLQGRLGLDESEFRLWIALHETTHAYEFETTPWLRGYLNDLITGYFETVGSDLLGVRLDRNSLVSLFWRVASNALRSDHVIEWVMTNEQRAIFRRMQAVMSLLEGYSNHVMQAVGAKLLPGYTIMKERFEERAKDKPPMERLFTKLIGLDLKLEQYTLGERFVNAVVTQRGIAFMNRVWDAVENVPTLEELRAPERWIARMSA